MIDSRNNNNSDRDREEHKFRGTFVDITNKSGGNTEKIWAHRFLSKPKMVAAGGLAGVVSLLQAQGDGLVKGECETPEQLCFFFV